MKQRSRLGQEVLLGDEEGDELEDGEEEERDGSEEEEEEEEEDEDAIVYTPAMKKRSHRDIGRGKGLGKPILGKGKGPLGKGMGKSLLVGDEDEEMEDAISGDLEVDAEGEDE
jgi:histone acetyltransferase SAS3